MLCAISGEAPQVPVASKKSGAIFEKRLIEAYIAENGKDPVTDEPLGADDLVDLRSDRTVKPRPPQLTSIPSLLTAFQSEWDALALERFNIQQQLEQTRRELSRALYENDAALRVIARLQKERDEARDTLSKLSINGSSANGEGMNVDGEELPAQLADLVTSTHESLSKTRRKRPIPEDWANVDDLGSFKAQKLSDSGEPSSRFIASDSRGSKVLHAAGQSSGALSILSVSDGSTTALTSGQSGSILDATWTEDGKVLAGSSTGSFCILSEDASHSASQVHNGEVTSVSVHPSNAIWATTSKDASFVFYSSATKAPVLHVRTGVALSTGSFHPDGHLFAAAGSDGNIKIFHTNNGTEATSFAAGELVQSLSFSENGYWLAASVEGSNSIQIWDLRKSAIVETLRAPASASSVKWDYTGQYLAAATLAGVVIFHYQKSSKTWSEPFKSGDAALTLAWGKNAKSLFCADLSGTIFCLS